MPVRKKKKALGAKGKSSYTRVFSDLWARLVTEANNPASRRLDTMTSREISRLIAREDARAVAAVGAHADAIARAAELFAKAVRAGGRAIYVGAGTSGRLGVLDAAELPPTFGAPKFGRKSSIGVMAGGYGALRRSVEGAEDDENAGVSAVRSSRVDRRDLVIGISASSLAPYVRGALAAAKKARAATVLITMNRIPKPAYVDVAITCEVGPEILAGSTRMKSGLATKAILHNISTTAMILAGKVYGNRMVELKPWSEKLRARGIRVIREISGASLARARAAYEASGRNPKVAIVMVRRNVSPRTARALLSRQDGNLRRVLEQGD